MELRRVLNIRIQGLYPVFGCPRVLDSSIQERTFYLKKWVTVEKNGAFSKRAIFCVDAILVHVVVIGGHGSQQI